MLRKVKKSRASASFSHLSGLHSIVDRHVKARQTQKISCSSPFFQRGNPLGHPCLLAKLLQVWEALSCMEVAGSDRPMIPGWPVVMREWFSSGTTSPFCACEIQETLLALMNWPGSDLFSILRVRPDVLCCLRSTDKTPRNEQNRSSFEISLTL